MSHVTRRPVAQPAQPAAPEAALDGLGTLDRRVVVWVVVLAMAIVVSVVGGRYAELWLKKTPVRHIELAGDLVQTDQPALKAALAAAVRGNFFTANLGELDAVARRHPWVEQVSVSRRWPDSVRVAIVERQPVARWADDGLVSHAGVVFRPREAKDVEDLPVFAGPRAQAAFILASFRDMNAILDRVGLRIERIDLTERMSWQLLLEGDIRVLVDGEDTLAKLKRLTMLYDRQLASEIRNIARLDLRYRNGIAVGWR